MVCDIDVCERWCVWQCSAKCHACHVKRRGMSPSATPATQSADGRHHVTRLCVRQLCVRQLYVTKLCVCVKVVCDKVVYVKVVCVCVHASCVWQSVCVCMWDKVVCVTSCVWQSCVWQSCMWQSCCDKVVCDKVVCDKVVCDKVVCDKVVCDKVVVTKLCVCDKVVCDKVVCDKVLCDKVVCDKVVRDKVVCDKVVCVCVKLCDKVVCDKVVCDKVVCVSSCVMRLGGTEAEAPGGRRSKTRTPHNLWGTRVFGPQDGIGSPRISGIPTESRLRFVATQRVGHIDARWGRWHMSTGLPVQGAHAAAEILQCDLR